MKLHNAQKVVHTALPGVLGITRGEGASLLGTREDLHHEETSPVVWRRWRREGGVEDRGER